MKAIHDKHRLLPADTVREWITTQQWFVYYGGNIETKYLKRWVLLLPSLYIKVVYRFLSRRRLVKFSNASWANCATKLATTACARKKAVFSLFTFANVKLTGRPRLESNTPLSFESGRLCGANATLSWFCPLWYLNWAKFDNHYASQLLLPDR